MYISYCISCTFSIHVPNTHAIPTHNIHTQYPHTISTQYPQSNCRALHSGPHQSAHHLLLVVCPGRLPLCPCIPLHVKCFWKTQLWHSTVQWCRGCCWAQMRCVVCVVGWCTGSSTRSRYLIKTTGTASSMWCAVGKDTCGDA